MTQRDSAPALAPLTAPALLPYKRFSLPNGIDVVYIHDPAQEVFKIDAVFEAGIYYQPKPLIASTAINMLNGGTARHTAEEIADLFDYYGAYIDFNCGLNKSELSLISLTKYAEPVLVQLAEMITGSIVPEKELDLFLTNKRQEHLVTCEKTSYLARKEFSRLIFGDKHPYANPISADDYLHVQREEVLDFCHEHVHACGCRLMLCGNVNETVLQTVIREFATLPCPKAKHPVPEYPFTPAQPGRYHVTKDNAAQTSLRIGKSGVRLNDPDYAHFLLLNTVLGGYFGSRLMSNIREEKGYTYGIQSFNVSLPQGSYWCIAAEVNNQHTQSAIQETFKEIQRLRTEPVPEEELNLVKNFLHGDLLRELDGVFSQSDALKHKLNYNMDNSIYLRLIREITTATPDDLLRLAQQYWNPDEMYVVTASDA